MTNAADDALLTKLKKAVAAANKAEQTVTTAQAELISRSKVVGMLLLEAKKRHSTVKDFEAFLKRVDGLKLSRAYDLLRPAGGRTTDEEIRKATRERVKKHRASKRLPKSKPEPPKPSVTAGDVTEDESAEASAERRKAESASLDLNADQKAAKASAHFLAEFTVACRLYLPKITVEADREKARLLVSQLAGVESKEEAA